MGEIEAVARQFVRLAGTAGPVLSLACLILFYFVWSFYFTVRVSFPCFRRKGRVVKGFYLSLIGTEKAENESERRTKGIECSKICHSNDDKSTKPKAELCFNVVSFIAVLRVQNCSHWTHHIIVQKNPPKYKTFLKFSSKCLRGPHVQLEYEDYAAWFEFFDVTEILEALKKIWAYSDKCTNVGDLNLYKKAKSKGSLCRHLTSKLCFSFLRFPFVPLFWLYAPFSLVLLFPYGFIVLLPLYFAPSKLCSSGILDIFVNYEKLAFWSVSLLSVFCVWAFILTCT